MGSSALLMVLLQALLLLAFEVASLSQYTDEAHRLRQHQAREARTSRSVAAKATMAADGEMQVQEATHHHGRAHHNAAVHGAKNAKTALVKKMYPFYHTTEEIKSEIAKLSQHCAGALKVTAITEGNMSLDLITVRRASAKPSNRVFILFGEHSRELISPESGLYFLRTLCGDVELSTPPVPGLLQGGSATDALEDAEFQMVLNANPSSRKEVENGNFCLRTNPDGVDLNRNWDEQWQHETAASTAAQSNPGPKPFSEPETRILRRLVTEFDPHTFLTVHSGTKGMYMPWAYDMMHLANYNGPSMMEVLRVLDKGHCECPFGAAGKEVGYPCPGTCLDYAYAKLNTSFAYAFEIYTSHDQDADLKDRWAEKMHSGGQALLDKGHHLGHPHFHDFFSEHSSDFVQMGSAKSGRRVKGQHIGAEESAFVGIQPLESDCFRQFNPVSQDDYDKTVKNWAEVYLQMSSLIAQKLRAGQVAKRTVSKPVY